MQHNYSVPLTHFATSYDCNAYGTGAYSNNACATITGTGVNPAPNPIEALANTGYNIIIPVALGAALIAAGAVVLAKRLIRRKNSQPQR